MHWIDQTDRGAMSVLAPIDLDEMSAPARELRTRHSRRPDGIDPARTAMIGPRRDLGPTDPVLTDPVLTDPVLTDPVLTDPVLTDPVRIAKCHGLVQTDLAPDSALIVRSLDLGATIDLARIDRAQIAQRLDPGATIDLVQIDLVRDRVLIGRSRDRNRER